MFDYETTRLLARKMLAKKGLSETKENLMKEMKQIQDQSNIDRSRIPFERGLGPSSMCDPFSLDRIDPDMDRL